MGEINIPFCFAIGAAYLTAALALRWRGLHPIAWLAQLVLPLALALAIGGMDVADKLPIYDVVVRCSLYWFTLAWLVLPLVALIVVGSVFLKAARKGPTHAHS